MVGPQFTPPLQAPNRARIRGAIDGGAINLIKRGRSIWFHRDYRYFTILTVSSWHRGHSKVRLSWFGVSAGSILTSHI